MDSDPLPVLEKSHALRRDPIHGQPQEKRFHFRHSPPGTKTIKPMDGKAQKTTFLSLLRSYLHPSLKTDSRRALHSRLPVILPNRVKGVDNPAVGDGSPGVDSIRWNDGHRSRSEPARFPGDCQFKFAF